MAPTRRAAVLGGVVLVLCVALTAAAPISVPAGGPTVATGAVAAFDTLYPNSAISEALCAFEDGGEANVVGIHSISVPGSAEFIFIEQPTGNHPIENDGRPIIVFDPSNPEGFVPIETTQNVVNSGVGFTPSGDIVFAGGSDNWTITIGGGRITRNYTAGLSSVAVLENGADSLALPDNATLQLPRWKPTVTLLPDGSSLIAGGVETARYRGRSVKLLETFNRTNASLPQAFPGLNQWAAGFNNKPFTPFQWVLPTGHVLQYTDNGTYILNAHTGKFVLSAGAVVRGPARPKGILSNYPTSGSAVLAPLITNDNNTVTSAEIIIFGGSPAASHPDAFTTNFREFNPEAVAARVSHRLKISWSRTGPAAPWTFTFGQWQEEDIGYPRVLPDATLLPNGDVVLLNGAQRGFGRYPSGNASFASAPAFWASLYQTDKTSGGRYTLLCGTETPRVFQASAALTVNGTILVAGADRDENLPDAGVPWFNGTGNVGSTFKIEFFKPPYVFDTASRPQVDAIDRTTGFINDFNYNSQFTVQFSNADNVTAVTLVAPSATVGGWNSNQRVISLHIVSQSPGEVVTSTPLDPYTAPPQYYMLFVVNGKTYSNGVWIRLVDYEAKGAIIPKP